MNFFTQENDLVFCNEVCCVIEAVGQQHNRNWCHFFFDSSNNLKAALLHEWNKFPSVPLAHVANMKKSLENMKRLVAKFQYENYDWNFGVGLEVIALLFDLQLGYTK